MKYVVTFTKSYEYEVEADSRAEAINTSIGLFESDMCDPIADTSYSNIEVDVYSDE